jgi:hypothetical protein
MEVRADIENRSWFCVHFPIGLGADLQHIEHDLTGQS